MAWKRCPGCTRAISQSADVCDYCGASYAEPPAGAAGQDPAASADRFDVDALLDQRSLFADSLHHDELEAFNPADLPEHVAVTSHETGQEHVAAPDDEFQFLQERNLDQPPAVAAFAAPDGGHAPDMRAVAPVVNRRRLAMAGVGLAAAAVLLVSFFSTRGAASPEPVVPGTAAAKPVAPAAATPRRAVAAPLPGVAHAPQWNRVTDGRWIGRSPRSLALELPALEAVHVWMRDVKPLLVVRCVGGVTDVFVYTQSAAQMEPQDGDHTVRVTLDEGREVTARWPDSAEHDALFARDGQAFVQQLMRARTLRFGFTPHNAGPVVARFDVNGLDALLAPAAAECGWKKTPAPQLVRARGTSGSARRQ